MKPREQLDLHGLHVLDGGMATELETMGFDLSGVLWSAQVLEDAPDAIAAVHRSYLEAGADCLITASYQVSAEGFEQLGHSSEEAARLAKNALLRSVTIAEKVRDAYQANSPGKVWVAASIGPYGAMLHNGSEYHGHYDCSFAELVAFHQRRIEVLVQSNADFLAFESVPSLEEAKAILEALRSHPEAPAYISFTCRDATHTSHGEPLRTCAELLEDEPQIIAIGVNCTRPELISSLLGELTVSTHKPIFVYPNSGERWNAGERCWEGKGKELGELAVQWKAAGARWIGGCCRTGPKQVRAIARAWKV